jgi:hypothetical protein
MDLPTQPGVEIAPLQRRYLKVYDSLMSMDTKNMKIARSVPILWHIKKGSTSPKIEKSRFTKKLRFGKIILFENGLMNFD